PAEPVTSSSVPSTPSGPGCIVPTPPIVLRGSLPPRDGKWHEPQDVVPFDESCSSQKSARPRSDLSAVIGFCGGAIGAGSGWSPGGGGGGPPWAKAKVGR